MKTSARQCAEGDARTGRLAIVASGGSARAGRFRGVGLASRQHRVLRRNIRCYCRVMCASGASHGAILCSCRGAQCSCVGWAQGRCAVVAETLRSCNGCLFQAAGFTLERRQFLFFLAQTVKNSAMTQLIIFSATSQKGVEEEPSEETFCMSRSQS